MVILLRPRGTRGPLHYLIEVNLLSLGDLLGKLDEAKARAFVETIAGALTEKPRALQGGFKAAVQNRNLTVSFQNNVLQPRIRAPLLNRKLDKTRANPVLNRKLP